MSFCLDTSFIVNYLRQKSGWAEKVAVLRKKGTFKISIITYAELYFGMLMANQQNKEQSKIRKFLADFQVEIVPATIAGAETYAQGRYFLENKGTRIDNFDLLIAATAKANRATLVTDNPKHFKNFPKLKILPRSLSK